MTGVIAEVWVGVGQSWVQSVSELWYLRNTYAGFVYVLITVLDLQCLSQTREVHSKTSTGNSFLFLQAKSKIEAVVVHVCVCKCVFNL